MSKNKNDKHQKIELDTLISHIGLAAMSVAALAGLIEMHEARSPKMAGSVQPSFANVQEPTNQPPEASHTEFIRREKDEIRHATVSYGVTMRSHPVSGTL